MKLFKIFNNIQNFDNIILLKLNKYNNKYFIFIMTVITYSGIGVTWLIIAAILYYLNSVNYLIIPKQLLFLQSLISVAYAWFSGMIVKYIFRRLRPPKKVPNFKAFIKVPIAPSFPSVHAATIFALFAALLKINHPLTFIVGIWALIISFSRCYLGVHFFTDVLGGIVLGIVIGSFIG